MLKPENEKENENENDLSKLNPQGEDTPPTCVGQVARNILLVG